MKQNCPFSIAMLNSRMVIFMIMTLMTIILIIKLHRHRPQVEKVGTDGSQRGNQRLPWQGTAGSQTLKLTIPNLETRGYHCKELPVPRS